MNHSSALAKKLAAYSAVTASMLAWGNNNASGQVLYTDIDPDYQSPYGSANLYVDLNNDGVYDFQFHFHRFSSTYDLSYTYSNSIRIKRLYGNQVIGMGGTNSSAAKLYYGAMIDSAAPWLIGTDMLMGSFNLVGETGYGWDSWSEGPWQGALNGYLGLRLSLNNHSYYGWIRLDVWGGAEQAVVKDYALNILADQPILAGEISYPTGGLPENAHSDFHILQTDNGLVIRTGSNQPFTITLSDMSGREIQHFEKSSDDQFVSTSSLASGIYFVLAESSNQSLVKKIFVR